MKTDRVLGALLAVVMGLACAHMAFAASASTPGAQLTEEALPDRSLRVYWPDVVNNYATGTAPGSADSSLAFSIAGVSCQTIRVWLVVSDSASAVVNQTLFVKLKYGEGTAVDSTGNLVLIPLNAPGTVDTITVDVGAISAAGMLYDPLAGERAVNLPPYDKASQKYFEIVMPPPPPGAKFAALFMRPGRTLLRNNAMAGAWAKGNMKYRGDYRGGFCKGGK